MTINMEVKKDALRQTQDGLWKLTLTILPEDMPVDLMVAPMGSRYAMAIVPIRDDESANPIALSSNGRTPDFDSGNVGSIPAKATSEGEKLRTRAVLLCGDESFKKFLMGFNNIEGITTQIAPSPEDILRSYCMIKSRSEIATSIEAQVKFKQLLDEYKDWQIENQYADNLNRYK